MSGAKLWIVLGRPTRLASALIAVEKLGGKFPGGCYLLRDDSQWWERAQWQPYEHHFAGVHAFARVKTCRGLVDLPRLYRESSERKRAIAKLPINPVTDVLIGMASVFGLGNAAASAHPEVYKVLCISRSGYDGLMRQPDRLRYRFTTSGWLQNRLVEPLAGLERTLHFKPRINPGGDGVRLLRLQKDPDEIYDATIVLSNSGQELPAHRNDQQVAARYPSMAELREFSQSGSAVNSPERHRRVIFFGTPYLLIHNLTPEVYIEHLNRCLEFIRRNYPGCDLIYRPHPIETQEAERLNLQGFKVENDREAAELYFLRQFAEIEAVYSVSSTVSRTALNSGLNAYALWRCFPFPDTAAKFFAKTMGDVPPEFDIADLTPPPVAYQANRKPDPNTRSFGDALSIAVAMREKIPN